MRISITRRGGFAGLTLRREIDTAELDPSAANVLQQLVQKAMAGGSAPSRMPDAFEYEITIDGRTYNVSDDLPAWRALIERTGLQ